MDIVSILAEHKKWVVDKSMGARANLSGANLYEANLSRANLSGANLSRANLSRANLSEANLSGADLSGANLSGANLSEANLSGADLFEVNLSKANLYGADLPNTCLDPNNPPNAKIDEFIERDGELVIGYRTRKAGHIDEYRDGRTYSADWFSTSDTECHPGLYLWPSLKAAKQWKDEETIRVVTSPADIHKAGSKYRCRWFKVLGTAE